MTPHVRIEILRPVWPFLWVKFVRGFNPNLCCARCLLGSFWKGIPFEKRQAGMVYEGALDFDEPFAYLCGVNSRRPYVGNLHLPMERNPRCRWTVTAPEIKVTAEGLRRLLPIPPLHPDVAAIVTERQARCRNYRWAAGVWRELLPRPERGLFGGTDI